MKLTISVPKPCHENWEAMSPDPAPDAKSGAKAGKGRHCAQCDHVVTDLTRATDAELVALFSGDARPKCARFDPAQLDRALSSAEAQWNRALPIAAFSSLLAVAAGHEVVAQQGAPIERLVGEVAITRPAPPPPQVMGQMMVPLSIPPLCTGTVKGGPVVAPSLPMNIGQATITGDTIITRGIPERIDGIVIAPKPAPLEFCGTVVDDATQEPLPFVTVRSQDGSAETMSEIDGTFKLKVPVTSVDAPLVIELHYVGYQVATQEISAPVPPPQRSTSSDADVPVSVSGDPQDPRGISGYASDKETGAAMPGTIVSWKGTALRVRCDAGGHFFLHAPEMMEGGSFTLEIGDSLIGTQTITLPAHAIPCCVPVRFTPSNVTVPPAGSDTCRDVGVLRLRQLERIHTMGIMVVTPKESRVQKITRPVRNLFK